MIITMFTKPNCPGCKFTARRFDELNVAYSAIDVTQDEAARQRVLELGYTSAPVVEVALGDGASWSWSGFAPTQLERLAELVA